jgi:hypothetical protein
LLKQTLKELFKWRDRAVHPPAEATQPALYQEIGVGTEWRFIVFCGSNARLVTAQSLSIVAQLLAKPRTSRPRLVEYCKPALANILPTLETWEAEFGKVYERPSSSNAA